jgi:hypothetical protein
MARKDLIISFFASSPQLRAVLNQLEMPYVLFEPQVANRQYKDFVTGAGNSILGMWNLARKASDELGRVAVFGFSEGVQGARACLETTDASAIDAVVACDGIHTQKIGPALEMSRLAPFIAYGRLAVAADPAKSPNTKLCIITHSAIGAASLPPGTASTTETGEVIWNEIMKSAPANVETAQCGWPCPEALLVSELAMTSWPSAALPVGTKVGGGVITPAGWSTVRPSAQETNFLPEATFTWSGLGDGWVIRRTANNLYVFGWAYPTKNHTKDPTGNRDHVFQAQMVLPNVVRDALVRRWNPSCNPVSGYGFFGDTPAGTCTMAGKGYYDQLAQPLDMGLPVPKIPTTCPQPPPGKVIVGREGDPCWLGPGDEVPLESVDDALLKAGALIAGGVAGWYGLKWAKKHFSTKTGARR